jgi:hypothetical protein
MYYIVEYHLTGSADTWGVRCFTDKTEAEKFAEDYLAYPCGCGPEAQSVSEYQSETPVKEREAKCPKDAPFRSTRIIIDGIVIDIKSDNFIERAKHFIKISRSIKWPTDEPEMDDAPEETSSNLCKPKILKNSYQATSYHPAPYRCPVCYGTGEVPGYFYDPSNSGSTTFPATQVCHTCNGKGIVWKTLAHVAEGRKSEMQPPDEEDK